MNEFKKVATIDFRVTGGTLEDAFNMMKKYQLYGQAGEDANIIYKGVSIPAGYSESIEEVEAFYQTFRPKNVQSRHQKRENLTKVEVDFYTEEDNLAEVFESMLQYRDHGYADKYSNIVYRDVVIPAGYCDTYSDLEAMYNSLVTRDYYEFLEIVASGVLPVGFIDKYHNSRVKIDQMEEIPAPISHHKIMTYQK